MTSSAPPTYRGNSAARVFPQRAARGAADETGIRHTLFAPMRLSMLYLMMTFGLFLMGNLVVDVTNMITLTAFVVFAFASFYIGYHLGIGHLSSYRRNRTPSRFGGEKLHRALLVVGAGYFLLWGINQFYDFGANTLESIIHAILSPGEAYRAKFDVFSERLDTERVSRVTQILVLFCIIYAIFLPLLAASWSRVSIYIKAITTFSIAIYLASFLFIGTLKGLGDVVIFLATGAGVMLAKQSLSTDRRVDRTRVYFLCATMGIAFFTYMAVNQVQRGEEFGISESGILGDVSDTVVAKAFGEKVAYGFYQTLAYPSHGYRGLAYSLEQPFEFSHGAGLSAAYESYRLQFLGGEDNRFLTYPFRAEQTTGWPAGMYWSTIFPWLASDLTFFGVLPFMLLMGYIFARVWVACLYGNSPFALAALGQMALFIAFMPANNQVLMQRQGLWAVLSLIGISVIFFLVRRQPAR